jgi:predicted phosphodiesterase
MKYAIISDVHGNLDALDAVLKDAETLGADRYIFVGDYCASLPYPNEVVDRIKTIENSTLVQGNLEVTYSEYSKQDPLTWTDGQFQAHYWSYRQVSGKNHEFLAALPTAITITDRKTTINITHSSADISEDIEYNEFNSSKVAKRYNRIGDYSREMLLSDIREHLSKDEHRPMISSLADDIYIFGHTHTQWNAKIGNKALINPGSCGLPLDGTPGAPYTLLHIQDNHIDIVERRVPYDFDKLINDFKSSSLFDAAPVWCDIILNELNTGFSRALPFLQFANEYAIKVNDKIRPYSVKTWTEAYEAWSN